MICFRGWLLLAALFWSSLSTASTTGLYHPFSVKVNCAGQEIFPNEASVSRFSRDFVKLLISDESEHCAMAYAMNLNSYIRHMINIGDKEAYALYFKDLNSLYLEARKKEKEAGVTCRFDEDSNEKTPHCESDRVLNLTQMSFRVWYEFFKKDLHNEMAWSKSMVIGGSSSLLFVVAAALSADVRSQALRFVTNSWKHFTKIFRATTTVTRSVGATAGRGAILGRGAVASRTTVAGAGAGNGVNVSAENQAEEYALVRSTDDFQIPFAYMQIEKKELGRYDRFKSYIPCKEETNNTTSKVVGYRKTGCRNILDLTIALGGGILPAYILQQKLYRAAVTAPMLKLGRGRYVKKLAKDTAKRSVKFAKNPVTVFVSGLIAVGTVGTGINVIWQNASYKSLVDDLFSNFRVRKDNILDPKTDKNEIETYLEANAAMSYAETLSLLKTGSHVDYVEGISVDLLSKAVCSPLVLIHGGQEDRAVLNDSLQKVKDEVKPRSMSAFGIAEDSDQFAKDRLALFEEGFDVLLEAQRFINSIDHPGYQGLKTPMYGWLDHFESYRKEDEYANRLEANVKILFRGSYEHSLKMASFRDEFESAGPNKSGVSKEAWRGYIDAVRYFYQLQQALNTSAHKFSCDYGQAYEFFQEEVFLPQAPCDLGDGYEQGLRHCRGI